MKTDDFGMANQTFCLGLSLLPATPGLNIHTVQSQEGRRVRNLLDRGCAGSSSIETEASGHPYFVDRHADFSISHSGFLAAASLCRDRNSLTGLPYRTGCDVEYLNHRLTPHIARIARRFFAPDEQDFLNEASTGLDYQRRFCRVWTLKECFLKLKGLSVFAMPEAPAFSLVAQNGTFGSISYHPRRRDDLPLVFYSYEIGLDKTDRYILSVARETSRLEKEKPPKLRWFSSFGQNSSSKYGIKYAFPTIPSFLISALHT
jgi:phosphopantetheinyl transferase (holo-ACP synthase)